MLAGPESGQSTGVTFTLHARGSLSNNDSKNMCPFLKKTDEDQTWLFTLPTGSSFILRQSPSPPAPKPLLRLRADPCSGAEPAPCLLPPVPVAQRPLSWCSTRSLDPASGREWQHCDPEGKRPLRGAVNSGPWAWALSKGACGSDYPPARAGCFSGLVLFCFLF